MNKLLTFLLSLICLSAFVQAQHRHEIDPNEVSVFADCLGIEIEEPLKQSALQNSDAWHKFEAQHGSWFVSFNTITELPMRAAGKGIEVNIQGNANAKALNFLQRELIDFQLPIGDLKFQQTSETPKYAYVLFKQFYKGLEILNSRASVRITADNKVVAFTLDLFRDIEVNTQNVLSLQVLKALALKNVEGTVSSALVHPELKVLPIPLSQDGYEYKLVYEVDIEGSGAHGEPFNYYATVDAHTGKTYYRSNRIATYHSEEADNPFMMGTVTDNSNWESETRALANMRVVIGEEQEEFITDSEGRIPFTTDTRLEGTAYLEGPYCKVLVGEEGEEVPSYPIVIPVNSNEVHLPEDSKLWETSVFHHTNKVHDFMKMWTPDDFTLLDYSMDTRVQRMDGSCNAFYNWSGINFYTEGGGCYSLAEFADVVFHEYGHAINHRVYEHYGGSMSNSSINEGYADVWSLALTKNPILAGGYMISNPNSFIRRYNGYKKRFPNDWISGFQHNNGEIVAGSWIDLQDAIGFENAFGLFVASQAAAPMRPNGQEGRLYSDVLFEALVADDDDGDLANGTPHSNEIFKAFGDHGIYLQVDADIIFEEIPNVPANTVIEVPVVLDIDFNYSSYLERIRLKYKDQRADSFKDIDVISLTGDNNYTVYILPFEKGTVVNFYFEIEDNGGANLPAITFPYGVTNENLPNHPYQLLVGYNLLENDDFSTSADLWTTSDESDTAKSDRWEIGSPFETALRSGDVVQSGVDYSPSEDNQCAVTGLNLEFQDYSVDENRTGVWAGKTTLISPVYDLTGFEEPAFSYYRWFTNHQGVNPNTESWRVAITNDGENWVTTENTFTGDRNWRFVALRVRDYVEPTATVQLRFVAEDKTPDIAPVGGGEPFDGVSLVEAMLDDVNLYDTALTTDIDGVVDAKMNWLTYPNPTQGTLYVRYLGDLLNTETRVQLYSLTGQLVEEEMLVNETGVIDTRSLSAGIYLLQIVGDGVVYQEKIVVE
ncbi:MAG: T9SS type A sorting domain-containing protein [Chitinophagales bacterium]